MAPGKSKEVVAVRSVCCYVEKQATQVTSILASRFYALFQDLSGSGKYFHLPHLI